MKIKSGFVTIVGKPNVGKSTLTNKLIGEELSIVTSKPQTTRKRILGILDSDEYQIVFLDTPGILEPKYLLQEKLIEYVESSVKDADVLIFMIAAKDLERETKIFDRENYQKLISNKRQKKILVINKIDLSNEVKINNAITIFDQNDLFDEVIPISALENYNLEKLLNTILEFLPYHPKFYPNGQPRIEGQYQDGMFNGRWIYYEDDGTIIGIGQYTMGTGKQKAWYRNGGLLREINYRDNEKHGQEIWYNADETISKIHHYEYGELISLEEF